MLRKSDATTKASQPKTAVFQWFALQRPIRAARPFASFRGDIVVLLSCLGGRCRAWSHLPVRRVARHRAGTLTRDPELRVRGVSGDLDVAHFDSRRAARDEA